MDGVRGPVHAVITAADLKSVFADAFEQAGMTSRRGTWRWSSPELTWLIELDRSPHGERYGLDLGVSLNRGSVVGDPARPTDCPILMHLENLPISVDVTRADMIEALDLGSGLLDENRAGVLRSVAEAVSKYVQSTATESALRSRFRAGDLRSAFVHKDVRAVLEGA